MIYCDYNATAPLRPEARDAILFALERAANPSSVHSAGRESRRLVENARQIIGGAIGSRAEDIVFTGGGTEANALAVRGALDLINDPVLLYSGLEHPAVLDHVSHANVPKIEIRVLGSGILDIDHLKEILITLETRTPFLCLMLANNETGAVQPVAQAAAMVRDYGGLVHCDAVQALGKIPVNVGMLGVDYLALSAHKLGGPQGVGALWIRAGAPLKPQLLGGGQERSIRSGTENVAGISGFAAAVEAALKSNDDARVRKIRDQFESVLKSSVGVTVFADATERLPGTSNFALEGFRGETQVMVMDLAGVAVSSGSACSSGKVKVSSVLASMGAGAELASSALRVSFGWASEAGDADKVATEWLKAARRALPEAFKESA